MGLALEILKSLNPLRSERTPPAPMKFAYTAPSMRGMISFAQKKNARRLIAHGTAAIEAAKPNVAANMVTVMRSETARARMIELSP